MSTCSLRSGVYGRCSMMDGHVSTVRLLVRRERVVLGAVGPSAGGLEGGGDPAAASPACCTATPAGKRAEADVGRPGAARFAGRCDPEGTACGVAAAGDS